MSENDCVRVKPFYFTFALILIGCATAAAQGVVTGFGSSRQKTEHPEWKVYPFETLDVISESDVPQLAITANSLARDFLLKAEKTIDFRYNGRLQVIIFKNELTYRQSNFGLETQMFNTGGYTYTVDNKVTTVFNGNIQDFYAQIRTGIAEVLLGEMMYGGSFQERAQTTTLLYVPYWYYKGAIEYLANGWTAETDAAFRAKFQENRFRNLNQVSNEDAALWGQSFWNFVHTVYGKESVPEILYLTRSSKGYENAFRYVLNTSGWMLFEDWRAYYQKVYKMDDANFEAVKKTIRLTGELASARILQTVANNKGNRIYVMADVGKHWKLYSGTRNGKTTEIRRWPKPMTPPIKGVFTPPVFAIDEFDKQIVIAYRSKHGLMLDIGSLSKMSFKSHPVQRIDMIQSLAISNFHDKIFASGIKNGQSDIYEYDIKAKKLNALTQDDYDDLDISLLTDSNEVKLLLTSNRPPLGKEDITERSIMMQQRALRGHDIFIRHGDGNFEAITNTSGINERRPIPYHGEYIGYLTDISGLSNVHLARKVYGVTKSYVYLALQRDSLSPVVRDTLIFQDSIPDDENKLKELVQPYIPRFLKIKEIKGENIYGNFYKSIANSHFNRGVISHTINPVTYQQILIFEAAGKAAVLTRDMPDNLLDITEELNTGKTYFQERRDNVRKKADSSWKLGAFFDRNKGIDTSARPLPGDTSSMLPKYYFQTDFPEISPEQSRKKVLEHIKSKDNSLPGAIPYRSSIQPRYMVFQLDNSILNTYYHPLGSPGFMFTTPPVMLSSKAVFSDLLNDIDLEIGMRLPFSFSGNDFFIHYENRKHKWHYTADYWRQSRRFDEGGRYLRMALNETRLGVRIPITETWSVRGEPFYRWENNITLGTDSVSQAYPNRNRKFAGMKGELIKDNTKTLGINMLEGFRGKIYLETFQSTGEGGAAASVNVAGWDLRHYQKTAGRMIWATRFAGASSFGKSKILYYIGGTENWVGSSFNIETETDANIPYTFQSVQNGMRGFIQNIRNGSSFALLNTELRIPVFDYLSKYPQRSDILRNLLLVPFIDYGTAWNGASPFDAQAYNTRFFTTGTAEITVRSLGSPFVGAFGFGFRSRLFRYYFRTDFSWGVADGTIQKQVFFFSLGQDF